MFTGAAAAIGLMYGAGFFFCARTHLSVMEYWRWWVVHLWVEGFFEVFATAALAFIFATMGLVAAAPRRARRGRLDRALPLRRHPGHLPPPLLQRHADVSIMAVGASFSALEVVPLVLIGLEAFRTSRLQQRARRGWRRTAGRSASSSASRSGTSSAPGVFGFLINPPIALYYMQGLNTTPVHAHTALFGVYGLLSLGLVLLVARTLRRRARVEASARSPSPSGR